MTIQLPVLLWTVICFVMLMLILSAWTRRKRLPGSERKRPSAPTDSQRKPQPGPGKKPPQSSPPPPRSRSGPWKPAASPWRRKRRRWKKPRTTKRTSWPGPFSPR